MTQEKNQTAATSLPAFKNLEEEANFWSVHSPLEFANDFKTEKSSAAEALSHILAVRLDADTIARLGKLGRAKGMGASTLARMWLLERLAFEQKSPP